MQALPGRLSPHLRSPDSDSYNSGLRSREKEAFDRDPYLLRQEGVLDTGSLSVEKGQMVVGSHVLLSPTRHPSCTKKGFDTCL